jgi:hypothetical protein
MECSNRYLSSAGKILIFIRLIYLSLSPRELSVVIEGESKTKIGNSDFSMVIRRTLYKANPQNTGGDMCGDSYQSKDAIRSIGLLDGHELFIDIAENKAQTSYFVYRKEYGLYCSYLLIFPRNAPGFDGVDIFYTFTNPSLTDEQKNAYRKTADEIVLSLQDEMR